MAQTLYRPARGACTHSHSTIVDALLCARSLYPDLELVAVRNGRVETLDELEERIRTGAAAVLYVRTKPVPAPAPVPAPVPTPAAVPPPAPVPSPAPAPTSRWQPTMPVGNQYKCPYGATNCGEGAIYCEPCNRRYEEFRLMLATNDF
jgi:hypothetical protein